MVSLKRVDQYLNAEEIDDVLTSNPSISSNDSPGFCHGTFSWSNAEDDNTQFQLKELDVTFCKGELNLIVGPIGSGKSSLLLALLGEMRLIEGKFYIPRHKGVAYVSQTAWLQNATIRDNILFDHEFDDERYWKVIEACALKPDLDIFEAGDRTVVGEKGVTLSGGQKQRIALARAVYSPAETVLLDDVLSALDVHVSKFVFEKCIKGELLYGRTVLLVTHHITMTRPAARQIVIMEQGRIVHTTKSLTGLDHFPQFQNIGSKNYFLKSTSPIKEDNTTPSEPEKSGKLVIEEERAVGRVSRKMIFQYMNNFGNRFFIAGIWFVVSLGQAGNILTNWWIARWSDASNKYCRDANSGFYIGVAVLIAAYILIVDVFVSAFYQRGAWIAAKKLHHKLVQGVFRASISWFDLTPIGRIINRFAKDISSIDMRLVMWLQYAIESAVQIVFRIGAVTSIMPVFAFPAVVMAVIGYMLGEAYVNANIAVKRCQSITESSLFGLFGDTIPGVVTIRAYDFNANVC